MTLTVIRPLSEKISDKYGEEAVIIPALFILIAALLVLDSTTGVTGLVITAILYGIGFGAAQPPLQVAIIKLAPQEKIFIACAASGFISMLIFILFVRRTLK